MAQWPPPKNPDPRRPTRWVELILWDIAHRFDVDAQRTRRCSLGIFPNCPHRLPPLHHTIEELRRNA